MNGIINYRVKNKYLGCNGLTRYVARPLRYSLIETDDFLMMVARNSGMNRGMLSAAFYAIEQSLTTMLCSGHSVRLGVLGIFRFSFSCRAGQERGEVSDKGVTRRRIIFTPGKEMQRQMEQVQLVDVDG